MIADMPRKKPPFVHREVSRHGNTVWYFRRGKGKRVRLPDLGSDGFDEAYNAALTGAEPRRQRKAGTGTLEWLIGQYRASSAYLQYSPATRRQRDNIFLHVIEIAGEKAFRSISETHIRKGKERRANTPAQARNFLDAMRGLFRWAKENGFVSSDPTASVKNDRRVTGDGFPEWTDEEVVQYEAHWPAGSCERVWLHVLLYTGLRRGDAAEVGWQHVKDGMITILAEKTRGKRVWVYIPLFPELKRTLETGPTADLAFVCGVNGGPLKKTSFGNRFKKACVAAGIVGKSAHGLRKLAATRAAEAGLTVSELEAMFGWTGGTMAMYYTRKANRKRLAMAAGEKIVNSQRPHLSGGAGSVVESAKKSGS